MISKNSSECTDNLGRRHCQPQLWVQLTLISVEGKNPDLSALTKDRLFPAESKGHRIYSTDAFAVDVLRHTHASNQLCHIFSFQSQLSHLFSLWITATLAQWGEQYALLLVICLTCKISFSLSWRSTQSSFVKQAETRWCWGLPHSCKAPTAQVTPAFASVGKPTYTCSLSNMIMLIVSIKWTLNWKWRNVLNKQ